MKLVIEPEGFVFLGVKAFFTARDFVKDHEKVERVIFEKLNIPAEKIYMPIQKHTNRVYVLGSKFEPVIADAVITARKNHLIGVLVADCVPILLYDVKREVVGAVHAGWKGTATQILINTIDTMRKSFKCKAQDISVAIGPSIRQCSYEVNEDVKNEVEKATGDGDYLIRKGAKYFIDLSSANRIQAIHAGVPDTNIWQSEECTYCNPDRFYSYRYSQGAVTGRQGGFIGMW